MKIDSKNKAVDTNILVYAYAENSPKSQSAAQLLRDCFLGNLNLILPLQVLSEFCFVAIEKYHLQNKILQETAEEFLKCKSFVKIWYKEETVLKALHIENNYKIGFWDALIAATIIENGIGEIYTEDEAFKRIKEIKAINIFQS